LTNLISFYDWVTSLVDKGKAVAVVSLPKLQLSLCHGLSLSHSFLLGKLAARGLDRYTFLWVRNWLEVRVQWVVVNGVKSSW